MYTSKRLTEVYTSSEELMIDNSSKLIFFSDCHRGDNGWSDDFARNSRIFSHALKHYYDRGFTYIEIGDGDELWKNRSFSEIKYAHNEIFLLMKKFYDKGRLYMIYGNHDIVKSSKGFCRKNMAKYLNQDSGNYEPLFEEINVHQGLKLKLANTQNNIFIVHGHQGDFINDRLWPLARFLVRYVWRQLELLGFRQASSPVKSYYKINTIEKNIITWVRSNNQMIIAGHTHRPVFSRPDQPHYFNTGCCVQPYYITGIEIAEGNILLIKWSLKTDSSGSLHIIREVLAGPEKLENFFK